MTITAVRTSVLALPRLLPGLLVLALILVLFRDTASAMVDIWARSETFAHAFLVPPIVLWLMWRRRADVALLRPQPVPWLLFPMASICLLWLLGEMVGVNAVTQFALVCLIVLSVPALFGFSVARTILFPLLFLFFAVPIGEFMVPYMMEWTADFTVAALAFVGIPVYREGLQFVIPSGNWSVVEACSGVRYLIASFMVGSLFAYLNYRSMKRRLIFMAFSLAVPIVANWLRAFLIVMLGHFSDNKLAMGADHLVYGWVFFGIVILAMFMVGARWAEPDAPAAAAEPDRSPSSASSAVPSPWLVVIGIATVLVVTQALTWNVARQPAPAAPVLKLPKVLEQGWSSVGAGDFIAWSPAYQHASAVATGIYSLDGDRVGLWIGYYRDQGYARKLVTSTNTLVEVPSERWTQVRQGREALPSAAPASHVNTALLRSPPDPQVTPTAQLEVAHIYWVGGRFTTSSVQARLLMGFNRLVGRGDDSAIVIFYTPQTDGAAVLRRFAAQQLGRIGALLDVAWADSAVP